MGPKRRGWFASSCLSEKELKAQFLMQDDHPLIPQTLWPGELWMGVVTEVAGQGPPLSSNWVAAPGRAISGLLQKSWSRWAQSPTASDALRSLPAPTATAPRQGEAVSLQRRTGGSEGPKHWRTTAR